jgi:S-DNA-T family DNA segregation ATPase FtsK/SpoIIIE
LNVFKKRKLIHTVDDVFYACGLCNFKKNKAPIPWKVTKASKTRNGWRIMMRFPIGKCLGDVEKQLERISTALLSEVEVAEQKGYLLLSINETSLPSHIPYKVMDIRKVTQGTWKVVVGVDKNDNFIYHDFTKIAHLLVGGLPGSGKTVFLKQMITTLVLNHSPDEMQLILIDRKGMLAFQQYEGLPHVVRTAESITQTYKAIEYAHKEMQNRMKILRKHGVEDLAEYEEETGKTLPRIFVIIDEAGELQPKENDGKADKEFRQEIQAFIASVARLGRGPGVHLVFCTQRPDAHVVTGQIKGNIEATVAFRVRNQVNSEILLGQGNRMAADLPKIPGRGVYQTDDETIIQTPFLGNLKTRFLLWPEKQKSHDQAVIGKRESIHSQEVINDEADNIIVMDGKSYTKKDRSVDRSVSE